MKVGYDIRLLHFSGMGRTIRGFLDHLDQEKLSQLVLFGSMDQKNKYAARQFVEVNYPIYSLKQHWGYSRLLKDQPISFFHMPHYDVPYFCPKPFVATVYDLIHFLFPEMSNKPFTRLYSSVMLKHVAEKSEKIIVISEHTKKDLLQYFPAAQGKTEVIYPGIDPVFRPLMEREVMPTLKKNELEKGYLLYVGNLRKSKNTEMLIETYGELHKQDPTIPPLVLVGKNSLKKYQDGFPPNVHFLGEVSADQLPALYNGASLFIFPSLYEGFGLPPLEAMACGVPVISSNRASLPEVCAEAAVYVDPMDPMALTQAIKAIVASPQQQQRLRQQGLENVTRFHWQTWTRKTWALYEKVHENLSKRNEKKT